MRVEDLIHELEQLPGHWQTDVTRIHESTDRDLGIIVRLYGSEDRS